MNTVEIARRLEETTCVLDVYDNGAKYSQGSGFTINSEGVIVTAAHVITGRIPIREEDWKDPRISITARSTVVPELEYRLLLCGLSVTIPVALAEPLLIDLAILVPMETIRGCPFIQVSTSSSPLGSKVMMAGYPDELETPLLFDQAIDRQSEIYKRDADNIERELEKTRQLLMLKSGLIGHVNSASFEIGQEEKWRLETTIYYIDNAMHSGSSGGPVVNDMGEAIGVITKRAVTRVSYPDLDNPNKEVPSGSALAISPQTILSYLERQMNSR